MSGSAKTVAKGRGKKKGTDGHQGGPVTNIMKMCLCGTCNNPVEDDPKDDCDRSIECYSCRNWFHQRCTTLTKQAFKFLEEGDNSIQWICPKCQSKSADETKKLHHIEGRIEYLVSLMSNLEETIMTKVDLKIKQQIENSFSEKNKEIEEKVVKQIEMKMEEKEEKEKRSNNIVIWNLPESTEEDTKLKKKEDLSNAAKLLSQIVDIEEGDLTESLRIGRKTENKPRLLKLTVASQEQKKQIIANARKINKPNTVPKDRIYINPDMTPAERDQEKKMRDNLKAELKERQEKGEIDLAIRGNRIVHLDGHRGQGDKATAVANTQNSD